MGFKNGLRQSLFFLYHTKYETKWRVVIPKPFNRMKKAEAKKYFLPVVFCASASILTFLKASIQSPEPNKNARNDYQNGLDFVARLLSFLFKHNPKTQLSQLWFCDGFVTVGIVR